MSNIHTNSLSSLLQTFIKGAEEEGLVAIAVGKEFIHPRKTRLPAPPIIVDNKMAAVMQVRNTLLSFLKLYF